MMQYRSLDQVRACATVTAAPPLTRDQRLRRWAEVLEAMGARPLQALRWVEFHAEAERRRLRSAGSPIAVAFADPVLREAGLAGDTLWEAQSFFGLSRHEAHWLLCDCLQQGRMTGRSMARRIRRLTRGGLLYRLQSIFA
jgi:hypothetical protein